MNLHSAVPPTTSTAAERSEKIITKSNRKGSSPKSAVNGAEPTNPTLKPRSVCEFQVPLAHNFENIFSSSFSYFVSDVFVTFLRATTMKLFRKAKKRAYQSYAIGHRDTRANPSHEAHFIVELILCARFNGFSSSARKERKFTSFSSSSFRHTRLRNFPCNSFLKIAFEMKTTKNHVCDLQIAFAMCTQRFLLFSL